MATSADTLHLPGLNTTDGLKGALNVTLMPDFTDPTLSPPQENVPPFRMPLEVVHAERIRASYIWVLVTVGVPANTACVFTILTMAQPPYYVGVLAVADTVTLLVKLLYHQLITHGALTAAACIFYSSSTFFGCFANWVLVLISLERFVAVCFPFKKQQLFSKKRVAISVAALMMILLLIFFPVFFFHDGVQASRKACVDRKSMSTYATDVWYAGLYSALYFFVPFVLVTVLTAVIIRRLYVIRQRRERGRTSVSSASSASSWGPEHSVSVMLISASLIFLVLVLPAFLYYLFFRHLFDTSVMIESARDYLFYQIILMLLDTTHAVNFFVYFLSAAKFRAAFVVMLRRCCPLAAACQRKPRLSISSSRTAPVTDSVEKDNAKDSEQCDTAV